ncbi:sec-independent translocase [Streptomyces sp. NPDC056149]|uniref:sec-independent translocase n=1 Tax=unclassified Streptomyces TaxID=2593676 RepID=UPI00238132D7|nr:sec-independent translocase [Streptomyces sp. WZ-12]
MFFGISTPDLLVIAVLAVLLFGPDKLPEFVRSATALLRKVRDFSEQAKADVRAELGPDFKDFEFEDLHPRTFVRKQLLGNDDLGIGELRDGIGEIRDALDPGRETPAPREPQTPVDLHKRATTDGPSPERPPFDADAT